MIKLIALDLDDTLLLPDCTIPPEAVDCLKQAADRGVQVMIATGRIFPSAEGYARQLGTDCPIVCYNGAMIRRPGEAATYAAYLDPALMHRVAVYCRERGRYLQMYSNDGDRRAGDRRPDPGGAGPFPENDDPGYAGTPGHGEAGAEGALR